MECRKSTFKNRCQTTSQGKLTLVAKERIKCFFCVPGDLGYERALPLSRTQQFDLSGSNHFSIIRVFVCFYFSPGKAYMALKQTILDPIMPPPPIKKHAN